MTSIFSPSPLAGVGDSPQASGERGALAAQARELAARPLLQAALSGQPLSSAILPREGGGARTFPTRKHEAYRYANLDALRSVWDELPATETIILDAGESQQQVWLADGSPVAVRTVQVELAAGASLEIFALNTAANYGRVELDVTMHDGAHFALNAANIGGGSATQEIVTVVRHVEPNGTSRQTVRSVLAGKATGSYLGKVAVSRHAQKTDGEQSVKAMLLDRGATANCKPELEIYADDVKCAHGASVGELDPNQLFYALSRGLDPAGAKALLLEGFIMQLWDEVTDELAREALIDASRAALRRVVA